MRAAQPSTAPAYKIVDQWPIPNGGFSRTVVVPPNPTEASLRALAQQLLRDTKQERNAFVYVYDDMRAARTKRAASARKLSNVDMQHHDRHQVGLYTRNANTGYHQMEITPKGFDGPVVTVTFR
ncbi:MAG: hypothetical protein ACXWCW_26810 [Burkholderiales bacterium]